MGALKAFFAYLIKVERIKMENPFAVYTTKSVKARQINTLTQKEFDDIIKAVDDADPIACLNNGEKKNMYFPYLKTAFKMFLLTGGRREEVIDLKWSDLLVTMQGVRFFAVANGKVERQNKAKNLHSNTPMKYFPVNTDLQNLLLDLGMEKYRGLDQYVFYPERTETTGTLKDRISKSFTHYRKAAGIEKGISLAELRKTYLTWMNVVMNKDTGVLSSHSTTEVLNRHYLDPTVISAVEKAALEFSVWGTKSGSF